jgi:hypothetical protein
MMTTPDRETQQMRQLRQVVAEAEAAIIAPSATYDDLDRV